MVYLQIFTDASVNVKSKIGYGAYLVVAEHHTDNRMSTDTLKDNVRIKRFEQTSSTKLELQTLLWSLHEIINLADPSETSLTIYTDSQNIIGLPARQSKLEQSQYFSSNNKRLNNYELYQEFYRLVAIVKCKFVKVKGHKKSGNKDQIDTLFSLVDKASRKALREDF